jgi:hypothetical protein
MAEFKKIVPMERDEEHTPDWMCSTAQTRENGGEEKVRLTKHALKRLKERYGVVINPSMVDAAFREKVDTITALMGTQHLVLLYLRGRRRSTQVFAVMDRSNNTVVTVITEKMADNYIKHGREACVDPSHPHVHHARTNDDGKTQHVTYYCLQCKKRWSRKMKINGNDRKSS